MPRKLIPGPVPPGTKWCHGCAGARSLAAFKPDRRAHNGFQSRCHECVTRRRKEREAIDRLCRETARRIMANQYAPTPDPESPHAAL